MKLSEFNQLIKEPCSITKEQTTTIENITKNYPYFQVAHVIHLKGLKKQQSFQYNKALKKTAAYTTNRTILFDFITSDTLDVEKEQEKEETLIQDAEVVDLEVLETETLSPEEVHVVRAIEVKKKPILESLQIGEPLEFDKSEKHSFNEWLQLTSLTPIEREEIAEQKKPSEESLIQKSKNFELIEQFIATKPKIKPALTNKTFDISLESTQENESLMTETLARVYLEQKKYDKAIKAFKILSLKYPEKSGFFADRIKAVKFLQKNNS